MPRKAKKTVAPTSSTPAVVKPVKTNILGESKKSGNTQGSNTQVTKKVTKAAPLKNKLVTDYFPIRRSDRKTEGKLELEKVKEFEKYILSGSEEDLDIKLFPEKGRGIITKKAFKKGDFILEYVGDLIDIDEAKKREAKYSKDENIGCYMYYFVFKNKKYCIDATAETGRLGRLVNHSRKHCNLKTNYFPIKDVPHLILIAQRDIEVGEELLYDYGDHSRQALHSHPWLSN